jgi:hypothetical protein
MKEINSLAHVCIYGEMMGDIWEDHDLAKW